MVGTSASAFPRSIVVMKVTGKPVHLQLALPSINKYCGMFPVDFTFSKQVWLFMQSFIQHGALWMDCLLKSILVRKTQFLVSSCHAEEGREEREAGYKLCACSAGVANSIPRAVTWNRNGLPTVGGTAETSSTRQRASLADCWCCTP